MCLNYGHPRLINLRNWREPLYDQLKSTSLQFDSEKDVHMNFTNHEEKNGYGLDLDLLAISYLLCSSYPRGRELVGNSGSNASTIGIVVPNANLQHD
jgi:hypothetical protein